MDCCCQRFYVKYYFVIIKISDYCISASNIQCNCVILSIKYFTLTSSKQLQKEWHVATVHRLTESVSVTLKCSDIKPSEE